jgi:ribosome-associated toxin RatA of RatAB toxin-antitoxin module
VVAKRMQGLIKIQSVYRSYQARKRKQSIKDEKLQGLFSKLFITWQIN